MTTSRTTLSAIELEYRRYKSLGDESIAQLRDDELSIASGQGNSVATLLQHVGGNLKSRFTVFLTTDGEKPDRHREAEFAHRQRSRAELLAIWEEGWGVLTAALESLNDDDLPREVLIRREPHTVAQALTRSLAHTSSHVGQIVLLAKTIRGGEWRYLSIPPAKPKAAG
jgi:hypothetical protein